MRHLALIVAVTWWLSAQAEDALPQGIEQMPAAPVADAPARLIFSRDSNSPNACDVELYVNQLVVAKLGPGERTSLDLPSGEVSVATALSPDGYCGGRGPESCTVGAVAPRRNPSVRGDGRAAPGVSRAADRLRTL